MKDTKITKDHLIERRREILDRLGKLDDEIHDELDRDPEEQAIQLEQQDVTLSIVGNLNKELADIEERLLEFESE